jgi:hypothetical protein
MAGAADQLIVAPAMTGQDYVHAHSRQANSLAQWLFAL